LELSVCSVDPLCLDCPADTTIHAGDSENTNFLGLLFLRAIETVTYFLKRIWPNSTSSINETYQQLSKLCPRSLPRFESGTCLQESHGWSSFRSFVVPVPFFDCQRIYLSNGIRGHDKIVYDGFWLYFVVYSAFSLFVTVCGLPLFSEVLLLCVWLHPSPCVTFCDARQPLAYLVVFFDRTSRDFEGRAI
jgi:hypothetical protein